MPTQLSLHNVFLQGMRSNGQAAIMRLRDISLTCYCGEAVGVLGPNGAGKTALLRVIANLNRPTAGSRLVSPKTGRVGIVLQRPEDHFLYGRVDQQLRGYAQKRLSQLEIEAILQQVSLSAKLSTASILYLSTGQKRLLAIACLLVKNPNFLLLDEPFVGLDYEGRSQVIKTLINLKQTSQTGLVIVSHHPDDLCGLIDRLWLLKEGRLIYDGGLQAAPLNLLQQVFSSHDRSLYYFLRQLEMQQIIVPSQFYETRLDPTAIAQFLNKGTRSNG